MQEYKECFVAFLDILGFRRIIEYKSYEYIKEVFDNIISFEPHPLLKRPELYNKVNIHIMSDSIICYIESSYENSFMALVEVCKQIQIRLAKHNEPILVRGGIAWGSLYHKDNVIFGQGLTKAYKLESTLAIYPRVIFTENTRKKALENMGKYYAFDFSNTFYRPDDDRLYYIDYLNTFSYIPAMEVSTHEEITNFNREYFLNLYDYVMNQLGSNEDASVRQKYLWLIKKIDDIRLNSPELNGFFDDIREKEEAERIKRFDASLEMD